MMRRSNWIKCVVVASLCLTATSCKRVTGSTPEQEFVDNFKALVMGSKEIDSHQDWNTVGNAEVKISVDFGNENEYTVFISQSPMIFDANAVYIGMAKLKSGDSKTICIPRPANAPLLYAACYDADGHAVSKPFSVLDGITELTFSGKSPLETMSYSSTTGNNWSVPFRALPDLTAYTTGTLVNPTDDVELNDEQEVHYQVSSDFTGFIPSLGTFAKKSVYVTATWILTFNQQVLRDNVLIVGEGGKIIVPRGFKLSTSPLADESSGLIYVLPGGEITGDGSVEFATSNGTYSYNAGVITTKNIDIHSCTFYNNGRIGEAGASTTILNGYTDDSGNPSVFTNSGISYLAGVTGDNLSIENGYFLKVNNNLTLNSSSKMDDGSCIECNSLTLSGDASGDKVLYMGNAAYMNCLSDISIENYGVQGPSGSGFKSNAVFKFDKCISCVTTDGVPGTYLLDHVELILPKNYPTLFSQGAINVWDGDKLAVGIGKLRDDFAGYNNLRLLFYWMNGYEGRTLDIDNYEWLLNEDKYRVVGTETSVGASGVDPSRQTCTYSTSPSYNASRFNKEETGTIPGAGSVYYLFETLERSTKDFDYNDVILCVKTPYDNGDGTFTANVQVACVGNKVETTMYYNNEVFGEEIHAAIGTTTSSTVNTTTVNRSFQKLGEILFYDGLGRIDNLVFSLATIDEKGQETIEEQPSTLGNAPLFLVINGNTAGKFFWPLEANNIGIAYPGFSVWGSNVLTAVDWYDVSNATRGRIVSY